MQARESGSLPIPPPALTTAPASATGKPVYPAGYFSSRHLNLEALFYLATLGGAEVCNLEDRVGNFVVGKEFDALWVRTGQKDVVVEQEEEYDEEVYRDMPDRLAEGLNPGLFVEEEDSLEKLFEKVRRSQRLRGRADVLTSCAVLVCGAFSFHTRVRRRADAYLVGRETTATSRACLCEVAVSVERDLSSEAQRNVEVEAVEILERSRAEEQCKEAVLESVLEAVPSLSPRSSYISYTPLYRSSRRPQSIRIASAPTSPLPVVLSVTSNVGTSQRELGHRDGEAANDDLVYRLSVGVEVLCWNTVVFVFDPAPLISPVPPRGAREHTEGQLPPRAASRLLLVAPRRVRS